MDNTDDEVRPLPPERSGAQREYLYFEDLSAYGQRFFSRLRVDTWYFHLGSPTVGQIDLGTAPIQAVPQAEFVAKAWSEALAALAPIYQPTRPIYIVAWSPPEADGPSALRISGEYAPEDLAPALCTLARTHEQEGIVFAVETTGLDTVAAVRTWEGEIEEQRFEGAGYLAIYANSPGMRYPRLAPRSGESVAGPWRFHAFLSCSAASLFFADNRDILVPARRFHRARKEDSAAGARRADDHAPATEDIEEMFSGSVTLLDPPPGTPETNQELSERNAPRLRAAISQWERLSGHLFQWARDFRQHGYP